MLLSNLYVFNDWQKSCTAATPTVCRVFFLNSDCFRYDSLQSPSTVHSQPTHTFHCSFILAPKLIRIPAQWFPLQIQKYQKIISQQIFCFFFCLCRTVNKLHTDCSSVGVCAVCVACNTSSHMIHV